MRTVSQHDYETAKAALAVHADYCKPYVQKSGWTVIPADAPRPMFEGKPLETDAVNAFSTNVELFELARDKPQAFSAYVHEADSAQRQQTNFVKFQRRHVTTWTGEYLGAVVETGPWHRNNMGGRWRAVTVKADFGGTYFGREYDSRQLVNLRRKVKP